MHREYFEPKEARTMKSEIYDWVESAVFAVVCMILVFTFIGRNISVDGASMEPTLQDGDRLISSRMLYTPNYGDIVVITQPNRRHEPLIKRVIATGGQEVNINFITGDVMVDGVVLSESYISERTANQYDVQFPVMVPEGHVFVMGDNRNDSWDSRDSDVGMIDTRYILGRVIYRIAPFSNRGLPDAYWITGE